MATDAGVSIITPTGTSSAARTPACRSDARLLGHHLPRLPDLVHPRHQRQHELDVPPHRGPEDGPDLGTEHLRLVEAHPDRAPAEEGVRFEGRLEGRRELVSTQVEGADDHGPVGERRGDPAEVLGLLVLGRQGGPAGQEELGAEQADALRSHPEGRLDLLGEVHVAHEQDGSAARGDRRLIHHALELQLELVAAAELGLGLLQLVAGGVEHYRAALTVEQQHCPVRDGGQCPGRAHHRRDAQAVGQDGGVRRPGAFLAHQSHHVLPIELHGEPGRKLVGHHDDLIVRGHGGDVRSVLAEQPIDHAQLDGVEVGQPLAQPGRSGPEVAKLQRLELVGGLGAELVVPDQGLDRVEELPVLGHEDLGIEDSRFFGAGPPEHPLAQLLQLGHRVVHRLAQPAHLGLDLVGPHAAVGHLGEVPAVQTFAGLLDELM